MDRGRLPRKFARPWAGALIVITALLVAACGGSSGSTSSTSGSCGTVPTIAPQDPDKVLSALPADVRGWYNGFETPVYKSQWANWKPKHPAPYTVGLAFGPIINPFQTSIYNGIQASLKKNPQLVGNVIPLSAPSGSNIAQEVQNYNSLVQQNVDLIIAEPTSTASLADPIQAAANRGIPTIMWINALDSRYAVNVSANDWGGAQALASQLKHLNGKGNVLGVHGIPSTDVDRFAFGMFKKMVGACPNMKWAGEVVGNFTPPVVQSQVLQFLSTHPQKIDLAVQTGVMAPAIIQAFKQAGRPVPTVFDGGSQKGSLAYWTQNMSSGYFGAGTVTGDNQWVDLASRTALRMLDGQGLKINTVVVQPVTLSSGNARQYVEPGWTLETPGTVEGKPSDLVSDSVMNAFFTNGRALS
ncbi:MAG: substrate-binding domain-containing protein [Candidatus Dormibacteraeota bacterium]|nr:substrate-binding domain-containing protein [Candidatus Dormibacteraeota bacterium]MBO0745149.1 substrate-binding domain-containing protein [Candidatus Dormibacteraeota bacterium]